MIGLLGKKIGMTQVFDEAGQRVPVTVLKIGPCKVTDLRTQERDGYVAVQLGFDAAKEKSKTKPELGQFKKAKIEPLRFVREIRTEKVEGLEVGQELRVDNFEVGDFVDIQATSKGRGYQGVVKRWNMKGAQTKSHGSKHGREPGSTGMSATPSRILKGRKMPGQMGNEPVTTQNLKVVRVDAENDLLAVEGSVPGANEGYLVIRTALKKKVERDWKLPSAPTEETNPAEEAEKKPAETAETKTADGAAEAEQGSKPAEVSDSKTQAES